MLLEPASYVESIAPNFMFEKVTEESGLSSSTTSGSPESVAHVPRWSLGFVESTGYVESSQSI